MWGIVAEGSLHRNGSPLPDLLLEHARELRIETLKNGDLLPGTGAVAPMKDPGFTRCEPWLTTGTMRIADVVFGMTHW